MKLPTMSRVDAIAFVLRQLRVLREVEAMFPDATWVWRLVGLRVSLEGEVSFVVCSPTASSVPSRPGLTVPHILQRAELRADPSGLSDLAVDLVDRAAVFA